MKISEQWLRQWVDPDTDTAGLVSQLTIAGLEVAATSAYADGISAVVVAEVLGLEPHGQADKLRVCRVNDGATKPLQVVCGAANVRRGMRVAFARVGAVLPGDIKIKKAKLRGVESYGMLCSEQELGLADKSAGLMELPADAAVGESVVDYLGLDDQIIELDLTPNRGDALGVLGVAREVAAINGLQLKDRPTPPVPAAIKDNLDITLTAADDCPAYIGRVVKGINPTAESPLWLREKLRRCGLRPISPVVDITNYVMLELGQPMHAFDLAKLQGGIDVRRARAGEKLALLDGKTVALEDDVLVIADEARAVAIAGVMGGQDTSVTENTRDIFFESAWFNPLAILGKARRYSLHTDASHRFERGVDPTGQTRAMQRATALLLEICGGDPGPICRGADESRLSGEKQITLRHARIKHLLGVAPPAEQVEELLGRLNMDCQRHKSGNGDDAQWRVTPPAYRFDINIEADLIEEVARLYGYNNIPETMPQAPQTMTLPPEYETGLEEIKDVLAGRGWQEAITYSFVDAQAQAQLAPDRAAIGLSNPLSGEMSQMRTSQWPGLVAALQHNQNRQQHQVRLFETGLNFIARENNAEIDQQAWVSGIAAGERRPQQWAAAAAAVDFFDVKGDLQALFAALRATPEFEFQSAPHPALHPGQSARILRRGQAAGWLGVLHPETEKAFSLEGPVILFELNAAAIQQARPRRFTDIPRFPAIRRDLAMVVDEAVTAAQILRAVADAADRTVQNCRIFDVYRGQGIEKGRKSVALALILRHFSRTLHHEDVEKAIGAITRALADKLNADLRD